MTIDALWNDEATEEEQIEAYQGLIDSGQAWLLEGHVGRTAHGLIEAGLCRLGPNRVRDFYGNTVPAHTDIEPGYPGSTSYWEAHRGG
jgi:hypothetical protein